MPSLSRRTFLRSSSAGAALAAGGAGLLTGCHSGPAKKNNAAVNTKVKLPTYKRYEGAKPDMPPTPGGVQPAFLRYPADPVSCVDGKPGKGGPLSAMVMVYAAAPPSPPKNKFWATLNDALNVDLKLRMILSSAFAEKLAVTVAGDDIPDVVQLAGSVPNTPELLAAKFQPLTEFLSGDNVLDYPLLANFTEEQWRTTVFNGEIYGLPIPREKVGGIMYRRDDIFEKLGVNKQPASYAEFKDVCKELTDEKSHRWATANWGGLVNFIQQMLGAPNGWKVENGKFISEYEDETYKKALSDTAALIKAGYLHPDAFSDTLLPKDLYGGGTTPMTIDNYSAWTGYISSYYPADPKMRIGAMLPPDYDSSTKAMIRRGGPSYSTAIFKKADKDRIRELLRVANYLASPFGTKEYLIRRWGLRNVDFTMKNGNVSLTKQGVAESISSVGYIADAPWAIYEPGHPEETKKEYDYQLKAVPMTVPNPAIGLFSNTSTTKGAQLGDLIKNAQEDILQGRKPLSFWDDTLSSWREQGGDAIRKEYEEAYKEMH
ncbi:MAG TPA: extracellular solute-binding protein [Mycobacteriales bacterium]|nr:extracellular solute-binding protein [Mycobacteriales bacterium]